MLPNELPEPLATVFAYPDSSRLSTNRTFKGYLVNADNATQDGVIIGDNDTAIPTVDA